jgi:predicted RNA polymerase sigma factor
MRAIFLNLDLLIRKDFCSEAIRLALTLVENPLTDGPKTNALLALMCFQSSRLEARINDSEEAVLYEDQDRDLWNKELIEKGNYYLVRACSGQEVSKYHLEARIAFWHTASSSYHNKWENILQLYNYLLQIEYSPVVALNRTFALAKVSGKEKAIIEAEKLDLAGNMFYHSLLGNLYSNVDNRKAKKHFLTALGLTNSTYDRATIQKNLKGLANGKNI